jgi:phasin
MTAMAETSANPNTTSKAKPKGAMPGGAFETPKFETPKFEIPKFELPVMEVPAAFREFAEKGVAQAKENYEKIKSAAEEATDMLEDSYSNASKGCSDYGLKVIEHARANCGATFDLMTGLLTAKSYAEAVELSSGYVRRQFEAVTEQAKDLAETAQKVATDTAEPIREGFAGAVKKAA